MSLLRLNEVITDAYSNGIFHALQSYNVPWREVDSIADSLDAEYHGNISGMKYVSPLASSLVNDNSIIVNDDIVKLARTIYNIYGAKWSKLYATMSYDYNPISNYDMTETMTDDNTVISYGKTHTRVDNLAHGRTGTDTETPNLTNTENVSVYGFNSSSPVPTDGTTQTAQGTSTTTYNTTDTDTGTQTDTDGGSDTHEHSYTLTRSGNIGVTTSQQMIQSERELWLWDFFHEVVFPDVDKILTIQIY